MFIMSHAFPNKEWYQSVFGRVGGYTNFMELEVLLLRFSNIPWSPRSFS